MACKLRRDQAAVITWTNNAAGSADISKGDLVHVGNGLFGVAVDDIDFGDSGQLIIQGVVDNVSVIFNDAGTVGQAVKNTNTNIGAVTTLVANTVDPTATSAITLVTTNLRLGEDVTASSAAQTISIILK